MLFEHWIYSTAIAIITGMIYSRFTGREHPWIIIASAYIPDIDIAVDTFLRRLGITLLINGSPIKHGSFHNIVVLLLFAFSIALLLHPLGIKFIDSFIFASIGFGAHLFEDALVFNPGYAFFWPLSNQRFGIGILGYTPNLYGIADIKVLSISLILVILCIGLRILYEGTSWIKYLLTPRISIPRISLSRVTNRVTTMLEDK